MLILAFSLFACSEPAESAPSATPPPVVEAPAPPAAPPAPPPPKGRGDHCQADSECGFDDPCMPKRCGTSIPTGAAKCEESWKPNATCGCVENQCAWKWTAAPSEFAVAKGCSKDSECALDVGTGTCATGGSVMIGPIETQGPICGCEAGACVPKWVEPVPCDSWKDCDYATEPRLHPIPAVPKRTKARKACEDGSKDAVCTDQHVCAVVVWSC
jgi:hypothetical protein